MARKMYPKEFRDFQESLAEKKAESEAASYDHPLEGGVFFLVNDSYALQVSGEVKTISH